MPILPWPRHQAAAVFRAGGSSPCAVLATYSRSARRTTCDSGSSFAAAEASVLLLSKGSSAESSACESYFVRTNGLA
jgi:hypothetical protein